MLGLSPRGIKLNALRDWLQLCYTNHGAFCSGEYNDQPQGWAGPQLFIDVQRHCLVPAESPSRYVALSYVWGNSQSSCTTRENVDTLRQNGKLMDGPCQLNAMDKIYANSFFTIIAAQNDDASAGLYGDRSLLEDWSLDEESHQLGPPPGLEWALTNCQNTRQVMLGHARRLMRTRWYSRAWTFQEHLFAPRKIVFHDNTVNWECLCASWHEGQDLANIIDHWGPDRHDAAVPPRLLSAPRTGFHCSTWPDMFRYSRLVSMYNRRDLSFPEDILDAFTGTLSYLSRSFEGGFISGLPQFCFDAALLWQPWDALERRISVRRSPAESILPSWSWIGWSGTLNSESWRSASTYQHREREGSGNEIACSWFTQSTVSWIHSETLEGKLRPVRVSKLVSQPPLEAANGEIPRGWYRQMKEGGEVDYRHDCDPIMEFRYPIPIRDQHRAHIPPMSSRYLHAKTRFGTFKLGEAYASTASACTAVDILDNNGGWCGALRMNRSASEDSRSLYLDMAVELVEISAGSVENQAIEEQSFDEWNRPQCPRRSGCYRFYNVLWIERIDGIAYRKALGRVEEKTWDTLADQMTDLVLG
ncbi:hypothetical protein BCR34DRAFT_490516 [Clohesyomyces aquaticus]|uniref:Heterokaryon incompatibility domain-containing protein n=1 Tax=Clohesyomyces aquaticus TaxID=1231657 RepID=A0A1Y1Z6T0_9PLEO|nr:hypothetical protein BCR34DRAFT_490516 [Clohesyomyces aquaticus]